MNSPRNTKYYKKRQSSYVNYNIKNQIKKMIDINTKKTTEIKYKEQEISGDVQLTNNLYHLSNVSGGVGVQERVGDNIDLVSLQYRITFTKDAAWATDTIRMLIVEFKESNGGIPVLAELLKFTGVTPQVSAMRNEIYLKKFRVIKDMTFDFDGQVAEESKSFDGFIKLKNIRCDFSTTSGGATQASSLWMITYPTNQTNPSTFISHFKLKYSDK